MFDDCYMRLGRAPFTSCMPLTPQLLASLYALPERAEKPLLAAMEALGEGQPWSESFAVAPEQTISAVGAMLRQVMAATCDLDPASIKTDALWGGGRAKLHLSALRDLWTLDPAVIPADLAKLKDFLVCEAADALQPFHVIWDRSSLRLTPLERAVLERLERHHEPLAHGDSDVVRFVADRKMAGAPETCTAGHVQRHLLNPDAHAIPLDDSLALLAVRDSLTECETAAAIIQRWLSDDESLALSDIGVIVPPSSDYALYLAESFAHAGLVASSMPGVAARRNIGSEALLHFLQCRRRPAPAMGLASLYCSPVLCWSSEIGTALANSVMAGDFQPRLTHSFTGKSAALFTLIRSSSPTTTGQLKDQLRSFYRLLSDDEALADDVKEAKRQITRLIAALGRSTDFGEPDLDKAIQFAATYQATPAERGSYYLGGVAVMQTHEAPTRFRGRVVCGELAR